MENNFYSFDWLCNFTFSASMTAEKSSSLRPRDLATFYSLFAVAEFGVGWETDSAKPRASHKSCHKQIRTTMTPGNYTNTTILTILFSYKPFVDASGEMQ